MNNRLIIFLLAAFGLAALPVADAGLININLTKDLPTGPSLDGKGILGGGTWNRIDPGDHNTGDPLVNSKNNTTAITATDPVTPVADAQPTNGNAIQSAAWGLGVNLTISNLIADQVYKVAVYSDRVGTESPPDTFTVNGVNKSLPIPGAVATVLPGIENVDYALFITNASGTGTINIMAPWVAGIQIEGVLPGEAGPQADLRIADKGSKAGKGDGIYAVKPKDSQTLTQETKKKRTRRYFVRTENDGDEVDQFYLMGWWSKKKANVKVIDRDGGGNVTAETFASSYRYLLCKDDHRRFKIIVKPNSRKRSNIKVRIVAAPSTLAASRKDLVVALTKVRP